MNFGILLLFGCLVAAANLVGGFLLLRAGRLKDNQGHAPGGGGGGAPRILRYLVALGAGFMLAVIFIEIVPETVELWAGATPGDAEPAHGIVSAMAILLAGYLLIHLFEHTIAPHFHFGEETHPEALVRPSAAYAAICGLSIHTFFDGVSVAAAFLVDRKAGLLVFLAVLLHKIPEGFTAASIMLASGRGPRRAMLATALTGVATLAGVLSLAFVETRAAEVVRYALPFSAGVTLYVAASDLIPEVNHMEHKNPLVSLFVFAGVALFYLLHLALEA